MPIASTKKKVIYSDRVPRSSSPHCHGVVAGGLLFVSGIPGFEAGEPKVKQGDFAAQMRACLTNVGYILEEAGCTFADVAKVNVFLDRRADFQVMNDIYREFFGTDPASWPARTTVEARLPRPDFLLEIECVALIPD
ncbi:RidA family protein [Ottowia thiooxydans]|uniref:2-iminobutanoate/2-iminopropanoate deaminase n=1 Tax=Ottowia thiooxydans TaxID=219182 RepID=A0ABV2Q5M7_9BURK